MQTRTNNQSCVIEGKKILIIGGGIGGLAAAVAIRHLFQQRYPTSTNPPTLLIIERDENRETRAYQGYSMSIRSDNGVGGALGALESIGLRQQLDAIALPGRRFMIATPDFHPLVEFPCVGEDGLVRTVRVPRNALRNMILDNVPADLIRWGTTVSAIDDTTHDGKVRVTLSSGDVEEADLVIVADGSHSKTRQMVLPNEKVTYSGAVLMAGRSKVSSLPQPLVDGHTMAFGSGVSLFLSSVHEGEIVWGISYLSKEPRPEFCGDRATQAEVEAVLKEALELGTRAGFGEPIPSLVLNSIPSTVRVFSTVDKLPNRHVGNIAFIGDACHPMTPFAANGAGMALMDGFSIGNELTRDIQTHPNLSSALNAFDNESMPRSTDAIQFGRSMIQTAHSTGTKLVLQRTVLRLLNVLLNHTAAVKLTLAVAVAAAATGVAIALRQRLADVAGSCWKKLVSVFTK